MTDALPEGIFVHKNGLCESAKVGVGTRIWAFAHVLPGAQIGNDCNICDHVFIEDDVSIGDRVTIKSGVQLWDGVRLGNDVFVGPNATFTNDRFPRSKQWPEHFLQTVVEDRASIGANATILPGIRVGVSAMVGAGAVVTRDVPDNAVVTGNPACVVRYSTTVSVDALPETGSLATGVGAATVFRLPKHRDKRGELVAVEYGESLPFTPRRIFIIHGVPAYLVRGQHAHMKCEQILMAVSGSVNVLIDDGRQRAEIVLDDPSLALHIPPMIWGEQYRFSPDSVLQVFASLPYDEKDYISNYREFIVASKAKSEHVS